VKTVYIIDSNYPDDYYAERADGIVAQQILKALGIKADLRLALDREHFRKALKRALKAGCDVLHISTHGDDKSIAICNDRPGSGLPEGIFWEEFVGLFQGRHAAPTALVMSACNGASSQLAQAFAAVKKRPKIIIGSSDDRFPADYVAAWALLYRRFKRKGIKRRVAQRALADISAAVHKNFRYLRWDDERARYLRYPGTGARFDVIERA
jgi:hypothetical protein